MDTILDDALRRELQLQRFATFLTRQLVRPTADEIARQLPVFLSDYETLNKRDRDKLVRDIKKYVGDTWGNIWVGYDSNLEDLLSDEYAYQLELYSDYTAQDFETPPAFPPASTIVSTGTFSGAWAEYVTRNINATTEAVNAVVQAGIRDGLPVQEMVKQVRGTYNGRTKSYQGGVLTGKMARQAESLIRTGVAHHTNAARDRFAQENDDIIQSRIFFATLDNRTTSICLGNHLEEYAIGDPSYPKIPLHFNCRSVYLFKTDVFDPLEGTRPAQKGTGNKDNADTDFSQIRAKTTADAWLKRQPKWYIEDTLGKTRADLFRKGDLPLKSLTDAANRPLSLEQLAQTREGAAAFRKVNKDG